VVGICTWLLFLKGLLFGDIGLNNVGRFLPGPLAKAASVQDPLTLSRLASPCCCSLSMLGPTGTGLAASAGALSAADSPNL